MLTHIEPKTHHVNCSSFYAKLRHYSTTLTRQCGLWRVKNTLIFRRKLPIWFKTSFRHLLSLTKLSISLKEAAETKFWLTLLHKTDLLDDKIFYSLNTDVKNIISLLVSILKKLKDVDNNKN